MLYNVTLKEGTSPEELEKAKEEAVSQGGKIVNEFTLIQGFTVEYPDDHVGVLKTNDQITVEADEIVTTQEVAA